MGEKIALFDMDGTLAAYELQLKEDLMKLSSPKETEEIKLNWNEMMPHLENRANLIKSQKDWWYNLPKIEDGFKVLDIAREIGFKIHVLTKGPRRMPQAWAEKVLWCQKHLGEDIDITITHDKGMVYGRVLVDDYPEYMERWIKFRPRGLGVMPLTGYNFDYYQQNVIKYNGSNWEFIRKELQKAFDRE